MSRQKMYPDTDIFTFYNANPKGRYTGDCIARAICTVLELSYSQVVMELAGLQCETGYADIDLVSRYMKMNGYTKYKQPRREDNKRVRGEEFCKMLRKSEITLDGADDTHILANIGAGHIVAIVNYKIHDTWDSSNNCIGNFWAKVDS